MTVAGRIAIAREIARRLLSHEVIYWGLAPNGLTKVSAFLLPVPNKWGHESRICGILWIQDRVVNTQQDRTSLRHDALKPISIVCGVTLGLALLPITVK